MYTNCKTKMMEDDCCLVEGEKDCSPTKVALLCWAAHSDKVLLASIKVTGVLPGRVAVAPWASCDNRSLTISKTWEYNY